jgi:hypothetical protein
MRRKLKVGLVLAVVAVAFGAFWFWPSQEPAYEGKRLSQWLNEGMRLAPDPYSTNQSVRRVVEAVQAIGTNAIPFLLQDIKWEDPHWWDGLKEGAHEWKLLDDTHRRSWRMKRAVWGFEALGTNAAPALDRMLALLDDDGTPSGNVTAALIALGHVAVPDLVKRLRATNWVTSDRAAFTLKHMGPAAETAIPSLVAMLDDTNTLARQNAVMSLTDISRQPERLVSVFRSLLGDSNHDSP